MVALDLWWIILFLISLKPESPIFSAVIIFVSLFNINKHKVPLPKMQIKIKLPSKENYLKTTLPTTFFFSRQWTPNMANLATWCGCTSFFLTISTQFASKEFEKILGSIPILRLPPAPSHKPKVCFKKKNPH